MTEKRQGKLIEVTYGRGLALLFSLALALFCFCAAPSWAQSTQTGKKTSTHAVTGAVNAPAARARSGGNHEGITVHGWWTIEVKNPDGTLAQRREFENALVTGGQGDTLLAALLGRTATAGTWVVFLGGSPGIYISESSPQGLASCDGATSPCLLTLTVTPPTVTGQEPPTGTTLTLQGGVPSSFGAPFTVNLVTTMQLWCNSSNTSVACEGNDSIPWQPLSFTSKKLDGLNGDPPAVSVKAGQTALVTVTFSFQ